MCHVCFPVLPFEASASSGQSPGQGSAARVCFLLFVQSDCGLEDVFSDTDSTYSAIFLFPFLILSRLLVEVRSAKANEGLRDVLLALVHATRAECGAPGVGRIFAVVGL